MAHKQDKTFLMIILNDKLFNIDFISAKFYKCAKPRLVAIQTGFNTFNVSAKIEAAANQKQLIHSTNF